MSKKLGDFNCLECYVWSMRLLFISVGTLLVFGMLLFMTRLWGLSQGYQAFEHPFLEAAKPWQVVRVFDLKEAEALVQKKKDVIFWLDLAKSQDHKFLVVDINRKVELTPDSMKEAFRGNKNYFYDLSVLRSVYEKEYLLDEFLEKFPNTRMIFNIRDNAMSIHTSITELITLKKASDRVLIQSDVELVLKTTKELQPLWLYGTSRSDIMRLLNFDSMGLLPTCAFVGDVFIAPFKVLRRPAFNQDVLTEVRRRKKHILLGPLESGAEILDAQSLKPDGYIYANSELFLKELDQHPAQ